jgi:uncharacterized protein (DUF1330 family)
VASYIVARITINDRERYAQYEAGFLEIFAAHKGRLLAVDEDPEVLEGEWRCTRTVLAEFPNHEEALAWYRSDDYQALAQHRLASSDGEIALIKGLGS